MLLTLLIVLFAAAGVLNFFASRTEIERLRSRLSDYWLFVEELPFTSEFPTHIAAVRETLRRYVPTIIGVVTAFLFLTVLAVAALNTYVLITNPERSVSETADLLERLTRSSFSARVQGAAVDAFPTDRDKFNDVDGAAEAKIAECELDVSESACSSLIAEVQRIRAEETTVLIRLVDALATRGEWFAFLFILMSAAVSTIEAILFAVSLIISLYVTLFLMKFMENARAKTIAVCLFDLVLAIVIPIATITTVFAASVFLAPVREGSDLYHVSGSEFDLRLLLYYAIFHFELSNFGLVLARIIGLDRSFDSFLYVFFMMAFTGFLEFKDFLSDLVKVAGGDWAISFRNTGRNWVLGGSILFSLAYIGAVAFLIVGKRSSVFRELVSRTIQKFADHPRPIALLLAILGGVLFLVDRLLSF